MGLIKNSTDRAQSEKLAKLGLDNPDLALIEYCEGATAEVRLIDYGENDGEILYKCWSLAALISAIPPRIFVDETTYYFTIEKGIKVSFRKREEDAVMFDTGSLISNLILLIEWLKFNGSQSLEWTVNK